MISSLWAILTPRMATVYNACRIRRGRHYPTLRRFLTHREQSGPAKLVLGELQRTTQELLLIYPCTILQHESEQKVESTRRPNRSRRRCAACTETAYSCMRSSEVSITPTCQQLTPTTRHPCPNRHASLASVLYDPKVKDALNFSVTQPFLYEN